MERPSDLFDRQDEWKSLAGFAVGRLKTTSLGVVYGRRRHGKSYLLEQLAASTGGFYHQAVEEERAPALARLAESLSAHLGSPALPGARFDDWDTALRALVDQVGDKPIILDEFPYLLHAAPELPSVLQMAIDASKSGRYPRFRFIICGSALSVMTELLTGQRALRGRASLEMLVQSFDYRESRQFWEINDIETAFRVNAVLGGAPGYRDLLAGLGAPASVEELPAWLAEGVLNPSHALYREAEYLLAEDPALAQRSLYQSVIAAVAGGATTRDKLAGQLGRESTSLAHPLQQLERSRFLLRDEDLLHGRRPRLRIVDPLLRFHFAVTRPEQFRFDSRKTTEAWVDSEGRFSSAVLGPHFEIVARHWAAAYASQETLGGRLGRVGFTQVNDRELKQAFELDVVVESAEPRRDGVKRLLAIGEVKSSNAERTLSDLDRLERLRSLLASRADVGSTKLLVFGRSGFDSKLIGVAAKRNDVELIDLVRMYEGS